MAYSRRVVRNQRNHVSIRRAVVSMLKNRRTFRIEGLRMTPYYVSIQTYIRVSQTGRAVKV
jgi:hypothetical protein